MVKAPVEEHGEHVRVRRRVLDLIRRQRSPLPIRALLRLVHVSAQHGRDEGGEAHPGELALIRERAQRERLDVDDARAERVTGLAEFVHPVLVRVVVVVGAFSIQRRQATRVAPSKPREIVLEPEAEADDVGGVEKVTEERVERLRVRVVTVVTVVTVVAFVAAHQRRHVHEKRLVARRHLQQRHRRVLVRAPLRVQTHHPRRVGRRAVVTVVVTVVVARPGRRVQHGGSHRVDSPRVVYPRHRVRSQRRKLSHLTHALAHAKPPQHLASSFRVVTVVGIRT